jgi:putative ABC transport system permease protein
MIAPRWHKVLADLWGNKLRSILVILSISVGVFAVGFVTTSFPMVLDDMNGDFQSVNAHSSVIYTDSFDERLLDMLK